MDLGLAGRVAIVTGGGQGCGKAYCLAFAEEGARVVIADINEKNAQQVAQDISVKGGTAIAMKVDVSKWEDVSAMVARTIKEFGQVDILVNNAGVLTYASIEEFTDDVFNRDMNINLKGAIYCTKAVVPHMKARKYGKIVNQSSMAAIRGHRNRGFVYSAAKAGLQGFARSMSQELGAYNINVNIIAPSMIDTTFLIGMPPETLDRSRKNSVFGRLAVPEDMVGIVLLLSSDRSSYITGQTIQIDGGQRPT